MSVPTVLPSKPTPAKEEKPSKPTTLKVLPAKEVLKGMPITPPSYKPESIGIQKALAPAQYEAKAPVAPVAPVEVPVVFMPEILSRPREAKGYLAKPVRKAEPESPQLFDILEFDLGIARDENEPITMIWDRIFILKRDGTVYFKKSETEKWLDLSTVRLIDITPNSESKFFLKYAAQIGKSLILLVGRLGSVFIEPSIGTFAMLTASELRAEYSPQLVGLPVWRTPTIIPHFTQEELAKAWDTQGNVTVGPENPHPIYGTVGTYMDLKAGLGTKAKAVLLGNTHLGTLYVMQVIWGCSPQSGACESVGFDWVHRTEAFIDNILFQINGTSFIAKCKNSLGEKTVALTWNADYAVNYHYYWIEWFPEKVNFFIDMTLVATIYDNIPHTAAGLVFCNDDSIGSETTLRIKQGLELEQFLDSAQLDQNVNVNQSFTNPASNPSLNLFVGKRRNVEVYAKSIAASKTVYVYGSRDQTNWRLCDTLVTAASSPYEVHKGYQNGYRFIKIVLVETGTGTSELEISAS